MQYLITLTISPEKKKNAFSEIRKTDRLKCHMMAINFLKMGKCSAYME